MSDGPQGWGVPLHERVLDGVGPGTAVLDVGCGPGTFAALAAGRGLPVSGVDPDRSALRVAAAVVPDADLRAADAHDLPWPDGTFGLVALVQVLEHVTNPVLALREAGRVCGPDGRVRATVWGRPDECEIRAVGDALAPLLPGGATPSRAPAAGPDGVGAPPLTEPERLRTVARLAGLRVADVGEVTCTFAYPDADDLVASVLDSGPGRAAFRSSGPQAVRGALLSGLDRFRDGEAYRFRNTFRVLDAAPAG